MGNTHICVLVISIFFSCFVSQSSAGNKQIQALDNLYKAKRSTDSAIDTSHMEPPRNMTRDIVLLCQDGLKKKDKISNFPGQPFVKFDQYGGYVTVNESAGRAFYYYFVEAEKSKQNLPLLLWLNGGPGCSSLAYGAMQELGPFRVNSDGKTLYRNKFAWNHAANVLFVESPAGVGFSYSNTSSDYHKCGDASTAADNYVFLLNWFERFPEYKDRDFYISGESYAGHYVPQLAHTILHYNKMANKTLINLKGILIGNAVINDETDDLGMYQYFGSHALVSDETSAQIHKYCDFSPNVTTQSAECNKATDEVNLNLENIDIYNIYAPKCLNPSLTPSPKPTSHVIDPCSEHYTYAYMNRADVQEAIHANVTKLDHTWEPCSDIIPNWHDSPSTIIPLLREFMENNLRVWIFSGDTDARVPITSTKYSINTMNLPIKTSWHAWSYQREAAGFVQAYEGDLTLATVLGAGHQVPSYKSKNSLALVSHFLKGEALGESRI
ncbi:serine carboxypeptidase-like 40 [Artemisia annua]|uniref:Carboxypeptidase n=1 Tax=Artemisia annua TaxID=35608 RepID=A0A2U1PMN8_ARTAN|nr:serine carboxypeptidase-like 40 [Artemisia annua]